MGRKRHHYERAFAAYLRERGLTFATMDDARKAILPDATRVACNVPEDPEEADPRSLKSFDFVLYGRDVNLLTEVKGRRIGGSGGSSQRLENWVTEDDIQSLQVWEQLFGEGFRAALVFLYWCEQLPASVLFEEVFEHDQRWYAVRAIALSDYVREMRVRSPKWKTVNLPTDAFSRLSGPLCPRHGRAISGEWSLQPLQGPAAAIASGL